VFNVLHKVISRLQFIRSRWFSLAQSFSRLLTAHFPYLLIPIEWMLICILRPIIKIRVGELESRAIGHFSLSIEVYLSECDLGLHHKKGKYLDLFYLNETICNHFLRDKWGTYFKIGSRYFLEPYYLVIQKYLPQSKTLVPYRHWRNSPLWQYCDIHKVLSKTSPHLHFTSAEFLQGTRSLERLGISSTDRLIAFHSRDPNFREGQSSVFGFRDSSIHCQATAMSAVAEMGFKAVRMGRNVREILAPVNNSIVDYASSMITSDFNDIFICSRCDFMVCTASGLEYVALSFRKPLVCVNNAQWGYLDLLDSEQYPLFIPKKQIWRDTGQPLTLSDIQKLNSNYFSSDEEYYDQGISVIDNTADEIRDVVTEMVLRLNGSWVSSEQDELLQKQFSDKLKTRNGRKIPMKLGKKYLENNLYLLD
jgi:putative glycosyltransferase (TIGR04372 family)